ncbi:MAG: M23 family metallopeptidase [Pseudomonadota bacterium]|nr:M23 family metallopeptidase [Pseudomonadota bacterium]
MIAVTNLRDRMLTGAALAAFLCVGAAALAAAEQAPAAAPLPQRSAPPAVPAPSPDPYAAASANAEVELFLKLESGDSLEKLLVRAGTARDEAARTAALLDEAGIAVASGADISLALGKSRDGSRHLAALALRPALGLKVQIVRSASGELRMTSQSINVDATPLRFRGRAGSGLFWSLRSAGVPADAANAYLDLVKARIALGQIAPADGFDLVLEHRKAANGETEFGALLYAGLDRTAGPDLQLVRWNAESSEGWYDPRSRQARAEGMLRPVDGRLTSRFGYRVHPILRIGRFHSGIDYGAAWGTPIRASADGVVTGAGWAGGYGRQVRLVHSGGLATSYSHMSEIAAAPGTAVRRGDIVGYVGSTGLSTGAHLHYEVRRNGRLLDPLQVQQAGASELSDGDRSALKVRLGQLLSI